jgi:hypothetical protein
MRRKVEPAFSFALAAAELAAILLNKRARQDDTRVYGMN